MAKNGKKGPKRAKKGVFWGPGPKMAKKGPKMAKKGLFGGSKRGVFAILGGSIPFTEKGGFQPLYTKDPDP